MWIYRAYDDDGLPAGESYTKAELIEKLIDEFGVDRALKFTIKRVYEKWLR